MTDRYLLHIKFISAAALGKGDGLPGVVDQDIEHDEHGFPFMRGSTLKGLLVEEVTNVLYTLKQSQPAVAQRYEHAAEAMFGRAGSTTDSAAALRVGNAQLPGQLRDALLEALNQDVLTSTQILEALTDIRRQTAMDETGRPEQESLRAIRVLVRDTVLFAPLEFQQPIKYPTEAKALLAAGVKAFRRAGTGRNRGTGRLSAQIYGENGQPVTNTLFESLKKAVTSI